MVKTARSTGDPFGSSPVVSFFNCFALLLTVSLSYLFFFEGYLNNDIFNSKKIKQRHLLFFFYELVSSIFQYYFFAAMCISFRKAYFVAGYISEIFVVKSFFMPTCRAKQKRGII